MLATTSSQTIFTLDEVSSHFEHWRATRNGRRKIPLELMEEAYLLVGQYPLTRIVKTLRLCFSTFRKGCVARGLIQHKDHKPVQFVELRSTETACTHPAGDPIHITLSRADGALLQIALADVRAAGVLVADFLRG